MLYYHTASKLVTFAYLSVLIGSARPSNALPASHSGEAPVANTNSFQHKYHGGFIDDSYQWVKDEGLNDTDVKKFLREEYAHKYLPRTNSLKIRFIMQQLKRQLKALQIGLLIREITYILPNIYIIKSLGSVIEKI